jgi:hypothetical protein
MNREARSPRIVCSTSLFLAVLDGTFSTGGWNLIRLDIGLTPEEIKEVSDTVADDWFTKVVFNNAESPTHPSAGMLEPNNALKKELLIDWIEGAVLNASVVDTLSANGAFSILASQAGARSVLGFEFAPGRVAISSLLARILDAHGVSPCPLRFEVADAYEIGSQLNEVFDCSLVLGGSITLLTLHTYLIKSGRSPANG